MPSVNRKIISEAQLLEIMDNKLHENGDTDLEDCSFTNIQKLAETDNQGCNWSSANLRCSGVEARPIKGLADQIIGQAKSEYNIQP